MRQLFVYILANKSRQLYIGVTSDLQQRIDSHRRGEDVYTARFGIDRLVYYERIGPPIAAIAREKQLKVLKRIKKLKLIDGANPTWEDLAPR